MNWIFAGFVLVHAIALGVSLTRHGEKKDKSHYNALFDLIWSAIVLTLIYKAITWGW